MNVLTAALLTVLLLSPAAAERLPPLTDTDVATWQGCLKRTVMRPPCCNACPLFTLDDAKALLGYLRGGQPSERGESLWKRHRVRLLKEFRKTDPQRFKDLYAPLYEIDTPDASPLEGGSAS